MKNPLSERIARAALAAGMALVLAACGGGEAEPPGVRALAVQVATQSATQSAPPRRVLGEGATTTTTATTAAAAAAATPATASTATAPAAGLPTAEETLDWAEFRFPTLFPKGPRSVEIVHLGTAYTVRAYGNGNHLGLTGDGRVYGLGPFTGGVLQHFGQVADYAAQVRADAASRMALSDLLINAEEADAEVGVEVLRAFKPASITTQVLPGLGGQTVYEVAGTTPKGRPFKAVLLGDEGLDLTGFKGQMRVQARLRQIQGQTVLAGRLIPRQAGTGMNPIAFVAGGPDVRFTGPPAGTVHQFEGSAQFQGQCGDDGLVGAYSFQVDAVQMTGALTGVRERGQPLACTPGAVEQANLAVALSYTAVETHMGILFSFQGSLNNPSAANAAAVARARSAPQSQSTTTAMPAQGLTISTPNLPVTTLRATAAVKSNVKQLGAASGAELISFDATTGTLLFHRLAGNLGSLAVNDIVSSAPRSAAPAGFLRRVTRIQTMADGKVEVRTRRANVGELLEEADIAVDQPFDATDVQRASALREGRMVHAAALKRPALARIEERFNLVLFDQDGNRDTTDDQVTVRGSFKVQPRVVVNFQCRRTFCSDPFFLGKFVLTEDAEITVSAKLKKELRESRQIARIPLPPITAGPLVFAPDIVVTVDLEGVVRAEVEVGATQSLELEAGVQYNGSFTRINNVTTNVGITGPTFEGSVEAKAGIYAALRLMLYGVAGVSAEVGPYARFEAQVPGTPAWSMRYGIEGNLGVDIDLIVFGKEWDVKLFDTVFNNKTVTAPNERPQLLEVGSKHLCDDGHSARVGVSLSGSPGPVRLYALTDDKEDGAGSGTVDWRSSLDGDLGRTRRADRHELSAPLRNGTHTITAVVTDSQGATRSREFTVQLAAGRCEFPGGLPSVDITSNDNPFPLVVVDTDGSLTLRARTAVGAFPACGSVTWKSNLERRNAGTTTGALEQVSDGGVLRLVCTHTFTNVYRNLAAQTITARFSNGGMTTTDSIDVGALIPLLPSLGAIQFSAPSGSRYVFEGDQVSFTAAGQNVVWSSSVAQDNLNGRTGNTVNGRFNTLGQRTIVARTDNGRGGFTSRSITINVLSALARQ
ncbi:MAG: hypothetical protein ACOVQT_17900 [Rubrivivax sp.]